MSRVVPDGRPTAPCMGTGLMEDITYVGLDVHKATVCAAVAEGGRSGGVRQLGIFENRPEVLIKMATRLARGVNASSSYLAVVIVADRTEILRDRCVKICKIVRQSE